ncbi:MAG TPA: GAF domain-containing protein [Solirubrobacteraceae bacterium]|nr:GAF domain-containing protein [Solirubrobacteraceae bacterium]
MDLIGTDPEILRLRSVLRDLVALSTIPTTWIGREPSGVAAGLADALIGLLQVDFAFVRLSDPGGAGAVDVMRGNGWPMFPQWLEHHLAARGRLSVKEVVDGVGGGSQRCRGVVIPIGVDAEAGVIAAAGERAEFPTEFDQLLLSLAGNHAVTAFQGARLIDVRRRVEQELRAARDELEVKVAERTAELRRTEGYLAEAQRLAHTGSFALAAPNGEPTHSSDEHSRLHGFDPRQGRAPSLREFLQHVHPADRARCTGALARAIRDTASFETEYRVVAPGSRMKYIHALAHPVLTASGEVQEFVGTVIDVTERKRAEEERQAQLWFFESMDTINRAIQGAGDLEQMMGDVLDGVLAIFGCDRAWLMHPCNPEATSQRVRMERTRPEYIGAFGLRAEIENDQEIAGVLRTVLASSGPVRFDPRSGHPVPFVPAARFGIRSMIAMAFHPKMDEPYLFGLHQCSRARVWKAREERLFQDIGRRLADAVETLSMLRDLRAAHQTVKASRDELRALADGQAALRRVATLVAHSAPPDDVFAAVVKEVGQLLPVDLVGMGRYAPDRSQTIVASWGGAVERFPVGSRVSLGGQNLATIVFDTGRPARTDNYADASGPVGVAARESGFRSAVGTPIIVEGRVWGVVIAGSSGQRPLPADTEARLANFTELLATAIANAESRAALAASRARVVAAADETRRRIERDLHDSTQQRLVSLALGLRAAQEMVPPQLGELEAHLSSVAGGLQSVFDEVREISRGIHPAILSKGGLEPTLKALARRSAVPVELDLHIPRRLPQQLEVAAYYTVSEALTNAAKHARASLVQIALNAGGPTLRLAIHDDGIGGADPARGSGLVGLSDRIESLGGRLQIASAAGSGTTLLIEIPVERES